MLISAVLGSASSALTIARVIADFRRNHQLKSGSRILIQRPGKPPIDIVTASEEDIVAYISAADDAGEQEQESKS